MRLNVILLILAMLCLISTVSALQVIPELYGFGTDTRAAYGDTNDPVICIVTDLTTDTGGLADSTRNGISVKNGSFLECINYDPPANTGKIILFEVSGTIEGDSCTIYSVSNNYTSILGQTAPSPGIVLKNSTVRIRVSNVLIQHLRIRGVPEGALANNWDPLFIGTHHSAGYFVVENVVVDHVSVSWGRDETGHIGAQQSALGTSIMNNITLNNCIISEGLEIGTNKGKGFCMWGSKIPNVTFIGNLFQSNYIRNPLIKHSDVVVVNNLVYNAGSFPCAISTQADCNWPGNFSVVGNVVKGGPWSGTGTSQQIIALRDLHNNGTGTKIYLDDNQCGDGEGGLWTQSSPDNWWDGATQRVWMKRDWVAFDYETPTKVTTSPLWPTGLTELSSSDVEAYIIDNVGARPADRDSVDTRLINEINNETGISSAKTSVAAGDWPVLAENNITLAIPSNPHTDSGNGYTNLEVWLQGLADDVEGDAAGAAPNITSWENNKTSNNTLDFTINTSEEVNFNATANQTITTWNWYKDTIDQSHNYDNITFNWSSAGLKHVVVNATNSNGTSNSITWNVTVSSINIPPNETFDYYKIITPNQTMVNQSIGTGHYTILINLTDTDLSKAQSDGDDIVFYDADNLTQLPHQISIFNDTTYHLRVYAGLTDLINVSHIVMYYGDDSVADTQNLSGTWGDNATGIWLFDDGAGSIANDSSGNNNNGTITNGTWTSDGLEFASTGYINITCASFDPTSSFTFISKVNGDTFTQDGSGYRHVLSQQDGTGTGRTLLYIEGTDDYPKCYLGGTLANTLSAINTNTDYTLSITYDSVTDDLIMYIDDDTGHTTGSVVGEAATGDLIIGAQKTTNYGRWDGDINCSLLYDYVMSPQETQTHYNNTESPILFITVGAEQSAGAADTKFEFRDGETWKEDPDDWHFWFDCFWNTSGYPDGVAPNADQTESLHSLKITNNGSAAGTANIKFNESSPSGITVYIDDDYTVAGAMIITNAYQEIGPVLQPGEHVQLSTWVKLENRDSNWEFIAYVEVQ